MDLSTIVNTFIKENNMTGREFHRRCGKISYAYVANIINGKSYTTGKAPHVSDGKLSAIAQGLGISLQELKKMMGVRTLPTHTLIKPPFPEPLVDRDKAEIHEFNRRMAEKLAIINKPEAKKNEPDHETAAVKAAEILIAHNVTALPIDPMTILKNTSSIFVVTFTEMAGPSWVDSAALVSMFGASSQDAVTYGSGDKQNRRYIVAYNQRLPYYMIQIALARELGHIVLGHDDSRTDDIRTSEALYFARYLLCPRPLIKALQDAGIPLAIETIGNLTGCYGRTIAGFSETPGAHVDPELNRKVKTQLSAYIQNVIGYQSAMRENGNADAKADFGTFMDGYEE